MADAIYDVIVAGVPHRLSRTVIGDSEFARLRLRTGTTTKLNKIDADHLERQFDFKSTAESGLAGRLAVNLACLGSKVAVLDLGTKAAGLQFPHHPRPGPMFEHFTIDELSSTSYARRLEFVSPGQAVATAISYGAVDQMRSLHSSLLVCSARTLCVEDRLWDVEGGPEFARTAIERAHAIGRTTVLLCRDSDSVFRNRAAMRQVADKSISYIAGEAEAALILYNLHRLDSLVPRLRSLAINTILRRSSHSPMVAERDVADWPRGIGALGPDEFWGAFLPTCLFNLAAVGSLDRPSLFSNAIRTRASVP